MERLWQSRCVALVEPIELDQLLHVGEVARAVAPDSGSELECEQRLEARVADAVCGLGEVGRVGRRVDDRAFG